MRGAGRGWDAGTGAPLSARSRQALGSPGSRRLPFSRLLPSPLSSPPSPAASALPGLGCRLSPGGTGPGRRSPPREEGLRQGRPTRSPKPCAGEGPRGCRLPQPRSVVGRRVRAAERGVGDDQVLRVTPGLAGPGRPGGGAGPELGNWWGRAREFGAGLGRAGPRPGDHREA